MSALHCNSRDDVRTLLEQSFGEEGLLLEADMLGENFFDLSTGVAGELFQTFTNYGKRLAIVLPETHSYSESFRLLIEEHRRHSAIRFFNSSSLARQWLGDQA